MPPSYRVADSEAALYHLFKQVTLSLGHHDWTLKLVTGHDSYCWHKSKCITLGLDYGGDRRQILLHEISHIETARFCNQKHNAQFWQLTEELIKKWLHQSLDENQKRHKLYTSEGYYAKIYQSW